MAKLTGKVAVITGAAMGIGFGVAASTILLTARSLTTA